MAVRESSPGTPKSAQCTMSVVHCSDVPGAGFGHPAERQRETETETETVMEGKGDRKRTEAGHQKEKKTDVQRTGET